MNQTTIQAIGQNIFGSPPQRIIRKTIGICNEVYELQYEEKSWILRMNQQKHLLYGTHEHLPLFQQLNIRTPEIVAEDYSETEFPFSYQILTKIPGKDLGLVMDELTKAELSGIAKEVSYILDQFNTLPPEFEIGRMARSETENVGKVWLDLMDQRTDILRRNEASQVLDEDTLAIYQQVLEDHRNYFERVEPRIFYDDLNFKNVMIHEGEFAGLVDLDFLSRGDFLSAIGAMVACWHGQPKGEFYIEEVMRHQQLSLLLRNIVRIYGLLHVCLWTSEMGIRFNSNSTAEINWEKVEKNRARIRSIFQSLES